MQPTSTPYGDMWLVVVYQSREIYILLTSESAEVVKQTGQYESAHVKTTSD